MPKLVIDPELHTLGVIHLGEGACTDYFAVRVGLTIVGGLAATQKINNIELISLIREVQDWARSENVLLEISDGFCAYMRRVNLAELLGELISVEGIRRAALNPRDAMDLTLDRVTDAIRNMKGLPPLE